MNQPMDIPQPADRKEEKFVTKTFLQAAENVEMTDQDVEIAENHGTEFKYESLMEYSNIQLDYIKVFAERVFVMVIGEFKFQDKVLFNDTWLMFYVTWAIKLSRLYEL